MYETVTQVLTLFQAFDGPLRARLLPQAFEAKARGSIEVHHALRNSTEKRPLGFRVTPTKDR